ncbi:MAG: hypothetical protein LBO66_03840 [Deltaproteobacteria bacterium]|jgi:TPR repeat protein|nr:hypothetical protein [Deltaproteobacteria bacterium]
MISKDIKADLISLAVNGDFVARKAVEILGEKIDSLPFDGAYFKALEKEAWSVAGEALILFGCFSILGLGVASNEKKVYKSLQKARAQGDMNASYLLAACAYYGYGVAKSHQKILEYAEEAISAAVPDAGAFLALAALEPPFANLERAFALASKAAEAENPYAMFLLFKIFRETGRDDLIDAERALAYLRRAVELDFPLAVLALADLARAGEIIPVDNNLALKLYSRALKFKGLASEANLKLGQMAMNGEGVPKNADLATSYFKRSHHAGNNEASFFLGKMAYDDPLTSRRGALMSIKMILRAAERGCDAAQTFIGNALVNDENISKRHKLYYAIAKADPDAEGDPEAIFRLGAIYEIGEGLTRSEENSFYYYEKAAALGSARANYHLSSKYLNGTWTPKNAELFLSALTKAAEAGLGAARFSLGLAYLRSLKDIPLDAALAQKWLEKGVESGYPSAFGYLGFFVLMGLFGEKDYKKAVGILRRGLALEDSHSYACLGYLLLAGKGVERNEEKGLNYLAHSIDERSELGVYFYAQALADGKHFPKSLPKALEALDKGDVEVPIFAKELRARVVLEMEEEIRALIVEGARTEKP